jgi:hypothetical protein
MVLGIRMSAAPVRVLVAAQADGGTPYAMFDVESVDLEGARLKGPLLLEIGEQVTLRLARGGDEVEVLACVTSVERGERDAVSVVSFVTDENGTADKVRNLIASGG